MNYQALDEALEYLEEGLFTPSNKRLLDKLEVLVKKLETIENAGIARTKAWKIIDTLEKANLTPEESKRLKELKARVEAVEKNIFKKDAIKDLKDAKDVWDNCSNKGCWEGYTLTVYYLLGLSQSDIARHFDKMQSKMTHTVKTFVHWMYGTKDGDELNDESRAMTKKLIKISDLNAKAIEIASNDDDFLFYIPAAKKFVSIWTNDDVDVESNIFKNHLRYLDDDFTVEKEAFIEAARENHIDFKI